MYAQVHAWRALGQLRAPEAIEPLLELLAAQGNDEDGWDDWVVEGVPSALGKIGPAAIPATVARLSTRSESEYVPTYYANALTAIAKQFPETRAEVIDHISNALRAASHPTTRGFLVSDLVDLGAKEAMPVIEAAFAMGSVDESIIGSAEMVKYELGLGPLPPPHAQGGLVPPPGWGLPRTGSNAKQRFNERQRKKKAEKKKNKKRK